MENFESKVNQNINLIYILSEDKKNSNFEVLEGSNSISGVFINCPSPFSLETA